MAHDYSVDLDEGIEMYSLAEARALDRYQREGLVLLEEPPIERVEQNGTKVYFYGNLPPNLSKQPTQVIGEYYDLQCRWTDYVSSRLVLAEAAYAAADKKLELAKALIRKNKLGTAQDKQDATIADSRYVALSAELVEMQSYRDLVLGAAETARRNLRYISRIIEAVKLEFEMGHRGGNLDGPRRGPPNDPGERLRRPGRG